MYNNDLHKEIRCMSQRYLSRKLRGMTIYGYTLQKTFVKLLPWIKAGFND